MKIESILQVVHHDYPIVSMSLTLDRDAPARGIIAIQSTDPVAGTVRFFTGINGTAKLYFTGYVEQCVRIDAKQHRLTVRALAGKLANRAPIAMRNSKLIEIIAALGTAAGVTFRTTGNWTEKPVPHFASIGTGDEALRQIGELSGLSDWMTLEQADGSLYIGQGQDVKRRKTVFRFDEKIFTSLSATGADCAFIPSLRPGMLIRIGDSPVLEITTITITAEKMRLGFEYA